MKARALALALAVGTPASARASTAAEVSAPLPLSDRHLDELRQSFVRAGHRHTYWAIYSTPVASDDFAGPMRLVGAPGEGVGCVDDAARIAIFYLTRLDGAPGPDAHDLRRAEQALDFLSYMDGGQGRYYNFIAADGEINRKGSTSYLGGPWWSARAFWAEALGARVLARRDPTYARRLQGPVQAFAGRLDRLLVAHDGRFEGADRKPAWLFGGGSDVTGIAVMGLLSAYRTHPSAATAHRIDRLCAAMIAYQRGNTDHFPYDALVQWTPDQWHAWGDHGVTALARAGALLDRPDWIRAARAEADHLLVRVLLAGQPGAWTNKGPVAYPQIAYGAEAETWAFLSLYQATHRPIYGELAGLAASWLLGDNVSHALMFDLATGRARDGLDARGPSSDSGAESTVESLLALQALDSHHALLPFVRYRSPLARVAAASSREYVAPDGRRGHLQQADDGARWK